MLVVWPVSALTSLYSSCRRAIQSQQRARPIERSVSPDPDHHGKITQTAAIAHNIGAPIICRNFESRQYPKSGGDSPSYLSSAGLGPREKSSRLTPLRHRVPTGHRRPPSISLCSMERTNGAQTTTLHPLIRGEKGCAPPSMRLRQRMGHTISLFRIRGWREMRDVHLITGVLRDECVL